MDYPHRRIGLQTARFSVLRFQRGSSRVTAEISRNVW
jgi:hypothetical protein